MTDYFLKIDGVDGESQDDRHRGEIELASFSWGETNSGAVGHAGGAGVGRVSAQDFHIVKRVDKASPKLFIACATGQHFAKAVLVARKPGVEQQEFLKLTFEDLLVTSYQLASEGGGQALPMDQAGFGFAKLEVSYRPQKPDGSLDAEITQKFDFAANRPA